MESTRTQPVVQERLEILEQAGFDEDAIERIRSIKARYNEGEFSDLTPEAKRLRFARWLFVNDKIRL